MTRVWLIFFAVALILDQASKWIVVHAMDLIAKGQIEVLPPFLNFHMAWNRGINFGLFSGDASRWLLIGVALMISASVTFWFRHERDWKVQASGGLLVGGALGNVIDRVIYGAVADFLNMSCCGIDNPFAFNVADATIFLGAVGLILFAGKHRTT